MAKKAKNEGEIETDSLEETPETQPEEVKPMLYDGPLSFDHAGLVKLRVYKTGQYVALPETEARRLLGSDEARLV